MFDSPWHWAVVAIVAFVLFFGWKNLPDMSRSLGRSLRIFKTEIKGMTDDDKVREQAKDKAVAEPPRALPPAQVVKNAPVGNDVPRARPRPTPSSSGHANSTAKTD